MPKSETPAGLRRYWRRPVGGRPANPNTRAIGLGTVSIGRDLDEALSIAAASLGITRTEALRLAIRTWLDKAAPATTKEGAPR